MNREEILVAFEKVMEDGSWSSWHKFEREYFEAVLDAPFKEQEEFERQSRRKPVSINGVRWDPVASADVVDKDTHFLHWKLREKIFARLDPEAAAENAANPERYDKFCIYCEMCTKERTMATCPVCEHELLDFPINKLE